MRKIFLYSSIIISGFAFSSCEKNGLNISSSDDATNQAQLKVVFFSSYRANPGYQVKINDVRVSNALTYATPFPGGGLNTGGGSTSDYLAVTPGQAKVSISFVKTGTGQDSVAVTDTAVNLEIAKKYSLYFADTGSKIKKLLVMDTLSRPDSGFAKYKFVNLVPDLPAVDLYIGTVKVASNIPYLGISSSFVLPTNNSSTTWAIRTVGGTTNLTTYAGTTSIGNQRIYTVVARGYNSISASSDPRRKLISLIYNQ